MAKRKYSTPELTEMGIQQIMKEDKPEKERIAKQLRNVAIKRIKRMFDKYGDDSYSYVKNYNNEFGNVTTDDINNMTTNSLVHYIKRTKDFLNAKTTITRYEELLDETWKGLETKIDFGDTTVEGKRRFAIHWSVLKERLMSERPDLYDMYPSDKIKPTAILAINLTPEQFTKEEFTDVAYDIFVSILTGNKYNFKSWAKDDETKEEDMW